MKMSRYHPDKVCWHSSCSIFDSVSGSKVSDFHFHMHGRRDVLGCCGVAPERKLEFDEVDVERPRASFVFDAVDSRIMCWDCRFLIRPNPSRMGRAVKEWWAARDKFSNGGEF